MATATKTQCSELVPLERSGHSAVAEGNLMFVWGGFRSVGNTNVYLKSDEIWVYDLEQGVWQVSIMTGEVPPMMSGACCCLLNGYMYIFGGCNKIGQTDQIYCVSLTDGKHKCRRLVHEWGLSPSPRDQLSCWVYNGSIIYFGGYGEKLVDDVRDDKNFITEEVSWLEDILWGWNNEVHIFDPIQASWSQPKIYGCAPTPRAAHASAILGCRGYICGGAVMANKMNDIFCLDLESWTWSEIIPVSKPPMARSWHTLTAVSDSSLFLFGGLSADNKPTSDGWFFDIETKKWREDEHPIEDKLRVWHTACLCTDFNVIVFGGSVDYISNVLTGHSNGTLNFQIHPYPLFRICQDYIAKNCEVLRSQIQLLPPKLLTAVQRRISFNRPSMKQH